MRRTGLAAWDSGSEGNYYSDYTGTDPDGDGIGNDPHPLPSALLTQTCSHGLRRRLATSITTTRSPRVRPRSRSGSQPEAPLRATQQHSPPLMSVATDMSHPPGALVILQAAAGRAR